PAQPNPAGRTPAPASSTSSAKAATAREKVADSAGPPDAAKWKARVHLRPGTPAGVTSVRELLPRGRRTGRPGGGARSGSTASRGCCRPPNDDDHHFDDPDGHADDRGLAIGTPHAGGGRV